MNPSLPASRDGVRLPHLPALDGLRGLAVIAVLLFHSGFSWARGGHLGVTAFFVLSGFLITSLLLVEHERTGAIALGKFWARRARRLVPAALLAVALGGLYLGYASSRAGAALKHAFFDGVASLFWVANWRFIIDGQSYDDLFTEPSPFRHFWSLAIEEQVYVLLPLVVAGVLAAASTRRAARLALGSVFAVAIVASTEWASLLHAPGDAPLRAYYGTDARLAEPAMGALLAVLMVSGGRLRSFGGAARRALDAGALAALLALGFLMSELSTHDALLYDGGLLLAAVLAAVVIAAATQGGATSRLLAGNVLGSLGRISYGVYLLHWPIFLWLDEGYTGMEGGALLLLRTTATITLALASYAVIEHPVRRGRLAPHVASLSWANAATAILAGLAVVTGTVSWPAIPPRGVEVASGMTSPGLAENAPTHAKRPASGQPSAARQPAAAASPATGPQAPPLAEPAGAKPGAPPADSAARAASPTTTTAPTPARYRVAFIGDSVAQNLAGGLDRWGAANGVDVLDLTIRGCPMSRGGERRFSEDRPWPIPAGCDWWDDPSSDMWRKLRSYSPDAIVVHDALNELPDRRLEDWPTWMRPGEPVFDTWLTSEYRELIDAVAEQKIGLLLLNVPCADWERSADFGSIDDADGRVQALNRTVYHEIGTSATRVLDLYDYLCPDGEFSDTVDGIDNARPDGFHLSDAGAERAAERLLSGPIFELVDRRRAAGDGPTP